MFDVQQSTESLSLRISSELSLVGRVIGHCNQFLHALGYFRTHDITLVTRELIGNAVIHGNQGRTELSVDYRLRHEGNGVFQIQVFDQGHGFDYRKLDMSLPEDPRRVRNRGFALVNAIATRLEFNEKGNEITVWVRL